MLLWQILLSWISSSGIFHVQTTTPSDSQRFLLQSSVWAGSLRMSRSTIYFLFGFHDNYTCGLIAIVYFLFIRTAIAHSIREQVQTHTKCLNLIGYNYDGSSVHDEDLRGSFLPKITTILREEEAVEQFTPILEKLTEPEIDKLERDRERDKRFVEQCHSGK